MKSFKSLSRSERFRAGLCAVCAILRFSTGEGLLLKVSEWWSRSKDGSRGARSMKNWGAGGGSGAERTRVQSGNEGALKVLPLDRGTEMQSVGSLYSFELILAVCSFSFPMHRVMSREQFPLLIMCEHEWMVYTPSLKLRFRLQLKNVT